MGAAFTVEGVRSTALRALNYTASVQSLRKSARPVRRLGELVKELGGSYWSVFTRHDCDPSAGVELITQSDMFAAEPAGRVIRRDSMAAPERHLIKRGMILIAGAGQSGDTTLFGRSIIADGRLAGGYLGPHAVGLEFPAADSTIGLMTYAYLNTAIGRAAIKSAIFGTSVPGLRLDILADLPIPLPEEEVQERVAGLIRQTVEGRERYLVELRAARKIIEDLPEMQEAMALCGERRGRCVAWDGPLPTLNAWTFASAGGALGYLKKRWSGTLADILEPGGLFNGPRFARIPALRPHGVDFLSQRDIFLIRPVPRRIVHPGFSDHLLFVPEASLLVGGHGTLGEGEIFGKVEWVSHYFAQTALTQDILRVQPRPQHAAVAYAFLSTKVGFRLLRSTAVGTKLLSMRPDLLRALPFPDLPALLQTRIAAHLDAANRARQAASTAEDEAVRIMETEVLPLWLA